MSEFEDEPFVRELIDTYNELYLAANVIETAERHLGKSTWDAETVAERANNIIEEIGGADEAKRQEFLTLMRADLESALGPLMEYQHSQTLSKEFIMLRFMINGRIERINKILGGN
ncbi:MAG TPA: hypothetical protein VLL54_03100 [Pyrinomonadaceae bacterium]|nr:hypothetical protein [Pyrinomonadaceae bacterium]